MVVRVPAARIFGTRTRGKPETRAGWNSGAGQAVISVPDARLTRPRPGRNIAGSCIASGSFQFTNTRQEKSQSGSAGMGSRAAETLRLTRTEGNGRMAALSTEVGSLTTE